MMYVIWASKKLTRPGRKNLLSVVCSSMNRSPNIDRKSALMTRSRKVFVLFEFTITTRTSKGISKVLVITLRLKGASVLSKMRKIISNIASMIINDLPFIAVKKKFVLNLA